jgi:hypothetical protein
MTYCLVNHHITGHLVFALLSTEWVMMCPVSDYSARCEIHAIICFLHTKNMSAVEIHRELCTVYGQNVMSKRTVRQCCGMFKDGWTNVYDEEQSGRSSVVSDDLVQNFDQKICERQRFTISELSCELPQNSRTVLHEIIIVRLGYYKICRRWVLKMLMGAHKMTFLEWYKDGDEFLIHIIKVTGDEIWASFVNDKTKELSKQWMHSHSTNKP